MTAAITVSLSRPGWRGLSIPVPGVVTRSGCSGQGMMGEAVRRPRSGWGSEAGCRGPSPGVAASSKDLGSPSQLPCVPHTQEAPRPHPGFTWTISKLKQACSSIAVFPLSLSVPPRPWLDLAMRGTSHRLSRIQGP